jgi:hypothetical protein
MVVFFLPEPSSSPCGVFNHLGCPDLAIPAVANGDRCLGLGSQEYLYARGDIDDFQGYVELVMELPKYHQSH